MKNKWASFNPREFKVGDIVCSKSQSKPRLIVEITDDALLYVNMFQCAFCETEQLGKHLVHPLYFEALESGFGEEMVRVGNIAEYEKFINMVNSQGQ